jgi:hypothetical protein
MRQVRPGQIPYLTRVLLRTQRLMKAQAYLAEHEASRLVPAEIPSGARTA